MGNNIVSGEPSASPGPDRPSGSSGQFGPVAQVRRLPPPSSQPPFDDETGATHGALALSPQQHPPTRSVKPRSGLRVVGDPAPRGSSGAGVDSRAHAPQPPDPNRWIATLAQAVLESLHGRRPVQQLIRWTDDAVYAALLRRAGRRSSALAGRPRVRTVRVCRIGASAAEAAVVADLGRATRAVAVRVEADGDRWVCTAFEVVERPGGSTT